jgi:hypothetical protein
VGKIVTISRTVASAGSSKGGRPLANLADVASLATGAGTLVLAVATFASVRSSNRSARVAERALMVGLRPLLVPSRLDDPPQKIFFQEGKPVMLQGGRGDAEVDGEVVYLAISVRNAGPGIAVLHGWLFRPGRDLNPIRPDPDNFRHQGRDILIAPGDIGFWQGAFRDTSDPQFDAAVAAVKSNEVLTIDLLYGDQQGGQRAMSRMMLQRSSDDGPWLTSVVRHWNVDMPDPR